MNNATSNKLAGVVEMLIADSSRINEKKPQKYWYPLSMATYGVEEIIEALDSMCSFRTTMWEKTERFENMFSGYQNCLESIMVNSGSSADLLLSFLLKRLSNKEEVLVSSVTWPTQIWSLMVAGFKPILVDVDPKTLNIDYNDLESKITKNTAGIALVHLMGNPCDMDIIGKICKQNELHLIEDCCEGMGASFNGNKIGNFGLGGAFSMFFSHHICSMEGGLIVCNNKENSDLLRVLRAHGWSRNLKDSKKEYDDIDPRYAFVDIGFNVRPTELQAGFGIHQLTKLNIFNNKRDKIVSKFFNYINSSDWLQGIDVNPNAHPSWLGLPFLMIEDFTNKRNWLMLELEKNGIETRPIVAGNIARQPVAKDYPDIFDCELLGANIVHERGVYIGLSPMQQDDEIDKVIEIFDNIRGQL